MYYPSSNQWSQIQVLPTRRPRGPGGEDPGADPSLDEGVPGAEGHSDAACQVMNLKVEFLITE